MIRVHGRPEYRVVVAGPAVSFRSPRSKLYKERVRDAWRTSVRNAPVSRPVEMRLDYFHTQPRRFDVDNVTKCVLDALNGIAYVDDRLVRVHSAVAHDLCKKVVFEGPLDLVKPLQRYADYLFVRLRLAG